MLDSMSDMNLTLMQVRRLDLLVDFGKAAGDGLSDPWIPIVDQLLQAKHDDPLNDRDSDGREDT